MNYYIDIMIKPDGEMRENPLMNLVYSKFHKALVSLRTDQIGISFPEYKIKLGRVLRMHGSQKELHYLQSLNWLGGLSGYCQISDVEGVPSNTKYRTISRIQTTMSKSKLKRLQRRCSITPDQEKNYKAKMYAQGLDNPYLDLESGSTGRKHRRFFRFGPLLEQPATGKFNSFGLSKNATVPWF